MSPDRDHAEVDVVIVGAGVVGAAIARRLSHLDLRIVLIDAADDVGAATSKANTALLHTGFDATPSTKEARLVRQGYDLLRAYCQRAGIAIELTGALLTAWTPEQLDAPGDPSEGREERLRPVPLRRRRRGPPARTASRAGRVRACRALSPCRMRRSSTRGRRRSPSPARPCATGCGSCWQHE